MKILARRLVVVSVLFAVSANASIVSVTGPTSSVGTTAEIIAAPDLLLNSTVTNTGQQGFDEMQGVLLTSDLAVDGGSISAGTRVDSHMIFLNQSDACLPECAFIFHAAVEWTFSGEVLGVMSDYFGTLEAASSALLGAPGTIYGAPFEARGFEDPSVDPVNGYTILGDTLNVSMLVTQPGDWIRVVTVPIPATWLLILPGLLVLALRRCRQT